MVTFPVTEYSFPAHWPQEAELACMALPTMSKHWRQSNTKTNTHYKCSHNYILGNYLTGIDRALSFTKIKISNLLAQISFVKTACFTNNDKHKWKTLLHNVILLTNAYVVSKSALTKYGSQTKTYTVSLCKSLVPLLLHVSQKPLLFFRLSLPCLTCLKEHKHACVCSHLFNGHFPDKVNTANFCTTQRRVSLYFTVGAPSLLLLL